MFENSQKRFQKPEWKDWFTRTVETFDFMDTHIQVWEIEVSMFAPLGGQAFTFNQTAQMFALTLMRRARLLAQGVERGMEADDVYSSASVARSLLELAGAAVMVHQDIDKQLTRPPVDPKSIQKVLLRALIGHRFTADLGVPPYAPGSYIDACVKQLGIGPKDDYQLLSDIAHPTATLMWTLDDLDACARFEKPTIDETYADIFLRVCVQAPMLALHHLTRLLDQAKANDMVLPPYPLGRPEPVTDTQ